MRRLALVLSVLAVLSLSACAGREQQSIAPPPVSTASSPSESAEDADTGGDAKTSQYTVGDILLADKTVVKAADFTAVDSANLPVAVIAGSRDDGTAFGVGVHRSDTPLQWAPAGTTGCTTPFTEMMCTDSSTGDTDGSDNWDVICTHDAQGAGDAAENYPAFHFINTYALTYGLPESYTSGWYMPSIAELCTVYENRAVINTSLQKIHELDRSASMDGLGTNWYWASVPIRQSR